MAEGCQLSQFRILIVDEYAPFRDVVHRMIAESQGFPQLQIIGEAGDGPGAVEKARELQPDFILLDISLPGLNGIEAARKIREIAPESKLVFVSQQCFPALVQEAMSTGAHGYIVKSEIARELSAAVNAIVLGKQFFSERLAGYNLSTLRTLRP
jgi:DNA-binding NarL/FixJ family response regulator